MTYLVKTELKQAYSVTRIGGLDGKNKETEISHFFEQTTVSLNLMSDYYKIKSESINGNTYV